MSPLIRQPAYDLVLFDLDGTLIDSRADIAAAVNHARLGLGMPPLPVPVIETYVGDGVRLLLERALQTTDPTTVQRGLELWREHYLPHCLDETRLYPGIEAMLTSLIKAGVKLGIVSNKPVEPSERILAGLGIRAMFASVVGGDSTPSRKPDPGPLRLAVERAWTGWQSSTSTSTSTKMASGHYGGNDVRVLMVGDSPNDIEGARRAGYASCGVLWGIGKPETIRAAAPDHLAATPDDVRKMLVFRGRPQ
jgi:phosphoglycolate phosphatase